MKNRSHMRGLWLTTAIVVMFLSIFLSPLSAQAVDKFWVGGTSWWDFASNWSFTSGGTGGAGRPANGEYVDLVQSDATNRTVFYWNTLYPTAVLARLTIDATGTGTMTLVQGKDPLAADYEHIGKDGTGAFTQTGGTNTVTWDLYLGYNSTGIGTYDLPDRRHEYSDMGPLPRL